MWEQLSWLLLMFLLKVHVTSKGLCRAWCQELRALSQTLVSRQVVLVTQMKEAQSVVKRVREGGKERKRKKKEKNKFQMYSHDSSNTLRTP